jgi:site-specific DNA-methyltransferase (adenine-specific)
MLPTGKKYGVIYADPPWKFYNGELCKYGGKRFTSIEKHYKTQSIHWIKSLSVRDIAEKDCVLFIWVTNAHLPEALEVIKAWGFQYKTIAFVWEKITKNGKTCCNVAPWTMKNYEICLLATRGAMRKYKASDGIRQKVVAERKKHSEKPEEVRRRIDILFPGLEKIELFARKRSYGWDVWGDEI